MDISKLSLRYDTEWLAIVKATEGLLQGGLPHSQLFYYTNLR